MKNLRFSFGLVVVVLCLACGSLANAQEASDVDSLIRELSADTAEARIQAIAQITELGPKASKATGPLLDILEDTRKSLDLDRRVCDDAALALKAIGKPAIEALIKKLKAAEAYVDYHVCALAIHNIGTDADGAADHLLERVKTAKGQDFYITMHALNALGAKAVPAMDSFVKALHDESFHTQCMGCDSIAAIAEHKQPPDAAVEQIVLLLEDGIGSSRVHAADCLGKLGPRKDFEIVTCLIKGTKDRMDAVRNASINSLGLIGPKAKAAVPTLTQLAEGKMTHNAVSAAYALWLIAKDADTSVKRLTRLMKDPEVEIECMQRLADMGPTASAGVSDLAKYLESEDADLRLTAVQSITQIGTKDEAVRAAIQKLADSDKDRDVARFAVKAIESFKTP